jgi:hypothetical protein
MIKLELNAKNFLILTINQIEHLIVLFPADSLQSCPSIVCTSAPSIQPKPMSDHATTMAKMQAYTSVMKNTAKGK